MASFRVACQHRSDFDALDLAAGEAFVHFAREPTGRAQADFREIFIAREHRQSTSGRNLQKLLYFHALESCWLLEPVPDPQLCALGDGQVGNVRAVEDYLAGRRGLNAIMSFARVDLPPPFGPVMTVNLSSSMVRDRLSMIRLVSFEPSATGTSNTKF